MRSTSESGKPKESRDAQGLTREQNKHIVMPHQNEEGTTMTNFIRDAAAFTTLVSFVAVLGFWTQAVHALV
jgi:hypothetical protein